MLNGTLQSTGLKRIQFSSPAWSVEPDGVATAFCSATRSPGGLRAQVSSAWLSQQEAELRCWWSAGQPVPVVVAGRGDPRSVSTG